MSDFAVKLGGLQEFQQLFGFIEPEAKSKLQKNDNELKEDEVLVFFPSPDFYLDVLGGLDSARDRVTNHWEDLSEEHKQYFRSWVCRISNGLTKEAREKRGDSNWRRLGIVASVLWASLRLKRNFVKEIHEAGEGLADAILEQVAIEPPREVESLESYLGISKNLDKSRTSKVRRKAARRVQPV